MDVSCPSLPPKILVRNETDAELRLNAQTTAFMAAHGCHFVECFWYVLLVIIKSFFLAVRDTMIARTVLYKVSIVIVSRSFLKDLPLKKSFYEKFEHVFALAWINSFDRKLPEV